VSSRILAAPRGDKHFTNRIMRRIHRAPWSPEEDERLKTLVASGASALRAAAAFKCSVSAFGTEPANSGAHFQRYEK
jgi:hypothetical protein